jgi:hypothetical protein
MNEDSHTPDFKKWTHQDLAQWAQHMYDKVRTQHDTIEQLRLDNKDLSKINRELLTKGDSDDWK